MQERIRYIIGHNRILLSTICAGLLFLFSNPNKVSIILGILLLLTGEAVRTWSSGHINKNKSLAKTGPYSHTRNPLYVGNFLLSAGFAIMSWNIIIIIMTVPAFILIYNPAIKWEEQKLQRLFGDDYTEYIKNVPRFFPRFSSAYNNTEKSFDWKLVKKHRELNTWFAIGFGVAIFMVKTFFPIF